MPLSKARDSARKRKERARFRLDKLLSPPQTSNAVQPEALQSKSRGIEEVTRGKLPVQPSVATQWKEAHPELDQYGHPRELDADGNPIPEIV